MSDWIRKEAEKIRAEERARERAAQKAAEDARVRESTWPQYWREIVEAVRSDVEVFNDMFDTADRQLLLTMPSPLEFTVQRTKDNLVQWLRAVANAEGVQLSMNYGSPVEDPNPSEHPLQRYHFVIRDGTVTASIDHTKPTSPSLMAEILLKQLFSPRSS